MIWLAAIGTWIKKIPWQVYACAGLILLVWYYGHTRYSDGEKKVQREWTASIEKGKVIVDELKKKQLVVTTKIVTVYVDKVRTIHEKGSIIIQKVPVYIPADTPDLPFGFRLLHDAAVFNTVPDPTSGTDGASVPVREATRTIVSNYETCHVTESQLSALQEWVQAQELLYQQSCKDATVNCNKGK